MRGQGTDRMPLLDEMIAGKHRVVRILAEGGMGVVVEAHCSCRRWQPLRWVGR